MEENKNKKTMIDELFQNLKFKVENQTININNGKDLLKYISKINEKALNFEKQWNYNKDIKEKEEKNIQKFIPLFEINNNLFYETISSTIKNTIEPPNGININIKDKIYNNVFILKKFLEEENELCFEIKLGHGLWNNTIFYSNYKDINNNYNKLNSFKIGLLKLNDENISNISDYLSISSKEINTKCNWANIDFNFTQENYNNLCEKYEIYKNYIVYSLDLTDLIIPIENNNELNRFIQKNDIIGITISNNKIKEYIEIKIYINGILIKRELIRKEKILDNNNYSDIDDDYQIEQKNKKNNFNLIPFIELGINKSIFIKDKPNNDKNKDITSNEKMKYFNIYNCLPLNYFSENTLEIQKITDLYLDLLLKIGAKIFNLIQNEKKNIFDQLFIFFDKYVFDNKTILKNKIFYFLSVGIDLEERNITQFKENILFLFYIIDKSERKMEEKMNLVKLILNLLIELIIENNFELINDYNLDRNNQNVEKQIETIRKNKFSLFFLLFDNFIKEQNIIKKIFVQESFSKEEDIINFCYAIFNSCFYKDTINAIDYLKIFYNQENKFSKKKFLESNFIKSITINNQNYENKLFNDIIQDYQNIISNIKYNKLFQRNQDNYFFKFLKNFSKSEDNISIVNGIIIHLLKNYFENTSTNLDKSKLDRLIYINYINNKNSIPIQNEETFLGKYNFKEINVIFHSFSKNIFKSKEIIDDLFFDLIVNCISNYYEKFIIKEKNATNIIDIIDNNKNIINYGKNYEINKINYMIEFYQIHFSGNFYFNLLKYGNYLMEIINLCMKNNYLNSLPYKSYLQNILFILKYYKLRCIFIEKRNLIINEEPEIISSFVQNALKYTTEFLGKYFSKIHSNKFTSKESYEELISFHITILNEVLCFDIGAIKHSLPDIKDNLILLFKNILELYNNDKYEIIYNKINSLIEFLYYYENNEHINKEIKKLFFKDIMAKEIEKFSKMKNDTESNKNKYIENTMFFNIFMIIYKRIKIVRDSIKSIFSEKNKNLIVKDIYYEKKYITKFTKIIKILYNFLRDNQLTIFYDIRCISFLKIHYFMWPFQIQNVQIFSFFIFFSRIFTGIVI